MISREEMTKLISNNLYTGEKSIQYFLNIIEANLKSSAIRGYKSAMLESLNMGITNINDVEIVINSLINLGYDVIVWNSCQSWTQKKQKTFRVSFGNPTRIDKWEKTGLLDNIKNSDKNKVVHLLEKIAVSVSEKYNYDYSDIESDENFCINHSFFNSFIDHVKTEFEMQRV